MVKRFYLVSNGSVWVISTKSVIAIYFPVCSFMKLFDFISQQNTGDLLREIITRSRRSPDISVLIIGSYYFQPCLGRGKQYLPVKST